MAERSGDGRTGDVVIVAYRPKPGREAELLVLVRGHVPFLRRLGLVTDRPALALRAADGVLVEVFEWRPDGIADAHAIPEVEAMWQRFAAVCDYVALRDLPEAAMPFAGFKPVDP